MIRLAPFLLLLFQVDALLEKADDAFRRGDFENAATLAREVVTRAPGAVHGHLILGVVAARNNEWDLSSRHFLTVVRLDPANPYGYFYLGQAKLYQHQWAQAINYFTRARDLHYPETERLMVELAMAQNEVGNPKQALETLSKISPPPDPLQAAQYHGVTAFALGKFNRFAEAIEAARRALKLDDSNVLYWDFLIDALIKTDQAPQALAEAIVAQRKFPDHADTQFLFALASHHVVESPLSALALRNLREAEPGSSRVELAQGLLFRKQGKTVEALDAFQRAARRGAPGAHLLLGILHKENGDYPAAEREFLQAGRLTPRSGQLMLELGKLSLRKGDLEQAKVQLEKAVEYMPDAPAAHYQLGLLYRRLGDTEKADQHLKLSK
jgi:tetratricopeptide (TPR) repeat protein